MAKSKFGGITGSPFKDALVPTPSPSSGTLGGMGTPISDGQADTKGEMASHQFANISGGEAGSKGFGPGKK